MTVDETETPRIEDDAVIRLPRQRHIAPDVEQPAVMHGSKPGHRMVRLPRAGQRRFERSGDSSFQATQVATAPRSGFERTWGKVRRVAIGAPISTTEQEHERLSKFKAL